MQQDMPQSFYDDHSSPGIPNLAKKPGSTTWTRIADICLRLYKAAFTCGSVLANL